MGTGIKHITKERLGVSHLFFFLLFLPSYQSIHDETERRQPQLQAVVDLAEALKALLRGHGSLVDDKVSLLQCNWIAVTSRAEEWLNLLLVGHRIRKSSMLF